MTALAAIVSVVAALAAVLRARYKFQFAMEALRDVPPARRAEVVIAVGEAWRGWNSVGVPIQRSRPESEVGAAEPPRAIHSAS
ncbi:hypothetical protein [Nocardioides sp.]|uniref:hypothetical protein n=1 Tax=Nocardioides sp. TaxID=35761 RepID=UPI0026145627|nr:hypothetical protein [Nocardioides sp.]MCW2738875.1 hypothetical protein [Nocardioides sp.]